MLIDEHHSFDLSELKCWYEIAVLIAIPQSNFPHGSSRTFLAVLSALDLHTKSQSRTDKTCVMGCLGEGEGEITYCRMLM